jgi:hypothetical protein
MIDLMTFSYFYGTDFLNLTYNSDTLRLNALLQLYYAHYSPNNFCNHWMISDYKTTLSFSNILILNEKIFFLKTTSGSLFLIRLIIYSQERSNSSVIHYIDHIPRHAINLSKSGVCVLYCGAMPINIIN